MNAANNNYQPRTLPERRNLHHTGKSLADAQIRAEMAATRNRLAIQENAMVGHGNTDVGGGPRSPPNPNQTLNGSLEFLGYDPQTKILQQFQEGREYYISQMQKAIMNQPNQYFATNLGYTSNPIESTINPGTEQISSMGANHPYDRARVRAQDQNIASMMLFPGTDMLAYSRSIEYPHSTTHTATFGF
jgi:hypothetical protein